jgi:hypothetical protein
MRTLIAFSAGVLMSATALAGGFNFTFDSDNQGWTKGNFSNTYANIDPDSNGPATWNAGGWIDGSDHSGYAFHFSPVLGGGHGDLFGQTISVDFVSIGGAGGEDPFLVLMSSTDFLVLEKTMPGGSTFSTYTYALNDSELWYFNSSQYYDGSGATVASNAQIQAVLSDLQYVGVSTDITSGGDTTRLDNVTAVPEPASMIALGLGGLALLRRRRNQPSGN